jgi:hypothetical protein
VTEFDLGVRLTVVFSESEAEAVCGLLRVNGIACRQRSAGHAEMLGSWWHEVLVAPHQLDEARALLDSDAATPPQ